MMSHTTFTHAWDYRNRLTESDDGANTIAYTYDLNNSRVKQDGLSEIHYYAGKLYDTDGTTPRKHVFLPNGTLIATVPLVTSRAFLRLAVSASAVGGLLALLWFGFARGTYVTIDENNNLYGTLFFFRGKTTALSDVVSIRPRHTFGGLMTEVYMEYREGDGTLGERGIASKQSLRRDGFIRLLEAIRLANPKTSIDGELSIK